MSHKKQNPLLFDVKNLNRKSNEAQITPNVRRMLTTLLEMGMSKEIIATFLEVSLLNPALVRYLAGPIIVHKSPWADTLPSWLMSATISDRLEAVFKEHDTGIVGQLATPSDLLAHMMPATMDAPLQRDWVNVYMWAGNETLTKHKRLSGGQSYWEMVGEKAIAYEEIKNDYECLARDIRAKVVDVARSRGWCKKPKKVEIAVPQPPSCEQASLLDLDGVDLCEPDESVTPPRSSAPDIVQLSLF